MMRIKCPGCKKPMGLEEARADAARVGQCPACGQRFRVPADPTSPAAAPDEGVAFADFEEVDAVLRGLAPPKPKPPAPAPRPSVAPIAPASRPVSAAASPPRSASRSPSPSPLAPAEEAEYGLLPRQPAPVPVGIPLAQLSNASRGLTAPPSPGAPGPTHPLSRKKLKRKAKQDWDEEENPGTRFLTTLLVFFFAGFFWLFLTLITVVYPNLFLVTMGIGVLIAIFGWIWFVFMALDEDSTRGWATLVPIIGALQFFSAVPRTDTWKPFVVKLTGILIAVTALVLGVTLGGTEPKEEHDDPIMPRIRGRFF